ncbi:hypothetical protein DSLASN_25700 [Desulfoluna limicola]|uniref:DUF3089 domain-containing protein n=1 Tax=Desulfoluna limicola TaxID=2810562 RepID=A0ABN6F380_9BACT|nr:DUF3089 domain-containing protein [Desulfoluna limicola]BCS96938.1 hypothetical protein DSLASN_25700 [Desulfoluna limicola]
MTHRTLLFFSSLIAFFSMVLLPPCMAMPPLDPSTFPGAPDYTQPEAWLAKPKALTAPVDVFFVYPTVLFNDTDWVLDPSRPDMRAAAQSTVDTQAVVFEGQANIYAPMYRQMNLAGLGLSDANAAPLQKMVHTDVWRALSHYLKYENKGRPFFLAGHSQGSMILADLILEHWGTTGAENQLIAALLIGWSLTPADLTTNPEVRMCERPDQTGCVISYNTMESGRQSVAPTLKADALAVNPLSWTMDGAFVAAEKNLGSVFFDSNAKPTAYPHFTSAQIINGGLIVQPDNVDLVTVKGGHFPEGVYHAFDYSLFYMNLKTNIAERIEAYRP